ncbi:hypothetical protein K9N68_22845 [Kovacikia minuta CCNUW1]|nr:hypothetical protein K9N68_22845 [Kovacikia minuta CCNUW1]
MASLLSGMTKKPGAIRLTIIVLRSANAEVFFDPLLVVIDASRLKGSF